MGLAQPWPVRQLRWAATFTCAISFWLSGISTQARSVDAAAGFEGADAEALREMLEGTSARRDLWNAAPSLVVLTSVLDYNQGDVLTGYAAAQDTLNEGELESLVADLRQAMNELTDGAFVAFRSVTFERVEAGRTAKIIRPGSIVVARYQGLRKRTGNIGYGGRSARQGRINAAAVMLDADFDRASNQRQVLRTHELGHALGYHHVEARPSVMNPKVGQGITEFDRSAVRYASQPLPRQNFTALHIPALSF